MTAAINNLQKEIEKIDAKEAAAFSDFAKEALEAGFSEKDIIDHYTRSETAQPEQKVPRSRRNNTERLAGYGSEVLANSAGFISTLGHGIKKSLERIGAAGVPGHTSPSLEIPNNENTWKGVNPYGRTEIEKTLKEYAADKLDTDVAKLDARSKTGKAASRVLDYTLHPLSLLPANRGVNAIWNGGRGLLDYGLEYFNAPPWLRFGAQLGTGYAQHRVNANAARSKRIGENPLLLDSETTKPIDPATADYRRAMQAEKVGINKPGRTPPSIYTNNSSIGRWEEQALADRNRKALTVMSDYTEDALNALDNSLSDVSNNSLESSKFYTQIQQASEKVNQVFTDNQLAFGERAIVSAQNIRPSPQNIDQLTALDKEFTSFSDKYKVNKNLTGQIDSKVDESRQRLFMKDNPAIGEAEAAKIQEITDHNARVDEQQKAFDEAPKTVVEYKGVPEVRSNEIHDIKQSLLPGKSPTPQVLANDTQSYLRGLQKSSRQQMADKYDQLSKVLAKDQVKVEPLLEIVQDKIAALKESGLENNNNGQALKSLYKLRDALSTSPDKGITLIPRNIDAQQLSQITKDFATGIDWHKIETGKVNLYDIDNELHQALEQSVKSKKSLKLLNETTTFAKNHYDRFRNNDYVRRFLNSQTPEKMLGDLQVGNNYDAMQLSLKNKVKDDQLLLDNNGEALTLRHQRYLLDQAFPGQLEQITNEKFQSNAQKVRDLKETKSFITKLPPEVQQRLETLGDEAYQESLMGKKIERPATAKELPVVELKKSLPEIKLPSKVAKGFVEPKDYIDEFNHVLTLQENLPENVIAGKNQAGDLEQLVDKMVETGRDVYGEEFGEQLKLMRQNYRDQLITNEIVQLAKDPSKPSRLLSQMNNAAGIQKLEEAFQKFPDGPQLFQSLKRRKFEQILDFKKSGEFVIDDLFKLPKIFEKKEAELFKALLGDETYNNLKCIAANVGRIKKNILLFKNFSNSANKLGHDYKIVKAFLLGETSKLLGVASFAFPKMRANLIFDKKFVEYVRIMSENPDKLDLSSLSTVFDYMGHRIAVQSEFAAKATASTAPYANRKKDEEK